MFKTIKKQFVPILVFLLCVCIFASSFLLYHLPVEAVLYPSGLCFLIMVAYFVLVYIKKQKKQTELKRLMTLPPDISDRLSQYTDADDERYRDIIIQLQERENTLHQKEDIRYSDMIDYYTTWVHQIKTPIAAMRLTLQCEDSAVSRKLTNELILIEQYVEMVLCYFRLDSESSDYLFHEYELDDIIKTSLRRFSTQFIEKGLKLEFKPSERRIITDSKWFTFVIDQLLSNAIKYTSAGTVSLFVEDDALYIQDTGAGIDAADLPRVFEKGYTGTVGRIDKKASGLGLYLCKRIIDNLGFTISIESVVGHGTKVKIGLSQRKVKPE